MNLELKSIVKNIKGVSDDSRAIRPGFAYVAIKGMKFNGAAFIPDAIRKGATYIITEDIIQLDTQNAKLIHSSNPRQDLALLSQAFFQPQPQFIAAATGTNGKTSTVNFFMQIMNHNNKKSASIGTLGLLSPSSLEGLEEFTKDHDVLTSPDAVTLNRMLQTLANKNFTHIAIEASSHGLSQHRLDWIPFKTVGFTNFSRDHLDYYGTLSAYFNAKKRLLSEVIDPNSVAVLNIDIPEYDQLLNICKERKIRVITYGKKGGDIHWLDIKNNKLKINILGAIEEIEFPLCGEFQKYNASCAAGMASVAGINSSIIANSLSHLRPVNGRLEKIITLNQTNNIYIDYAHTPDALKNVLVELRRYCKNRIILVFGCGGDRDVGKRQSMGQIADEFADLVIVTDDNPRNEIASNIRKEIMLGAKNAIEIEDRRTAISHAISVLQDNDCILIAGKGHENYQIIGTTRIHYSDKETILGITQKDPESFQ